MRTKTDRSSIASRRLCALLALLLLAGAVGARAQDRRAVEVDAAGVIGVVIGVKGGLVFTMPRREFPSLRVGESATGTGTISSSFAETGLGHRYGIELLIPFTSKFALALESGVQTSVTRLAADGTRPAIRMDLQSLQLAAGLQGNIYVDTLAFRRTGLRNVYIGGGADIDLYMLRNRVEGFRTDTLGGVSPAVGSFENNDPFRTLVALRFAAGVRYGVGVHWELLGEASYAFAFNSLFSSDVVRDNGFTLDNIGLSAGIGYRF